MIKLSKLTDFRKNSIPEHEFKRGCSLFGLTQWGQVHWDDLVHAGKFPLLFSKCLQQIFHHKDEFTWPFFYWEFVIFEPFHSMRDLGKQVCLLRKTAHSWKIVFSLEFWPHTSTTQWRMLTKDLGGIFCYLRRRLPSTDGTASASPTAV